MTDDSNESRGHFVVGIDPERRIALPSAVTDAMDDLIDQLLPELERIDRDPRIIAGTHHVTFDTYTQGAEGDEVVRIVCAPRIVETIRFIED